MEYLIECHPRLTSAFHLSYMFLNEYNSLTFLSAFTIIDIARRLRPSVLQGLTWLSFNKVVPKGPCSSVDESNCLLSSGSQVRILPGVPGFLW